FEVNPLRYAADVRQAADNLRAQKTRTLLTALGIVFGVGSVIGIVSSGARANLRAQKTRTLLTALGIVFGVGSVIGMLSIGAGAREESLRMIEKLGVRNLLIESRPATSQEALQPSRL